MTQEFKDWYAGTEHARLSRRPVIEVTPENVDNVSRFQLEQYLERRGFAVYDDEETSDLREAVRLDLEERGL